jgi:tyrosyl-tRNA synthetase
VIVTMPLLEGLDGVQKMSKSLGNYVGIAEPPAEIFGKLMSISDALMWRYLELLSFQPMEVVHGWRREVEAGRNPRDVKVAFAREIVARFPGRAAAEKAEADFAARFRDGAMPDEIPEVTLPADGASVIITQILKQAGLTASTSESLRMIEQGGVRLGGERVSDKGLKLAPGTYVLQVGKRKFARVTLR